MNATVARLTARSLLGRRRVLLLLLLPAVLLLLSATARGLGEADVEVTVSLLGGLALGTLVPLLGLIVGTGAIGPEIDDGSIVYLLAKPLSRHTIVVTKLAVAATVLVLVAAVPVLVAGVVLTGSTGGLAMAFAVGAAVAGLGYCALFLLLAVITRNAVVVGLLYALVWETLIGGFVPGAQALSIQQWSLAITEALLGDQARAAGVEAAVTLGRASLFLPLVVVASTWCAGTRLRTIRITTDE